MSEILPQRLDCAYDTFIRFPAIVAQGFSTLEIDELLTATGPRSLGFGLAGT
jgi:hypothetical protein